MMRYFILRLFLTKRDIPPILEAANYVPEQPRQEYLETVFERNINFIGSGVKFTYVYLGREGNIIFGKIGRKITEVVNRGPETKFAETKQMIHQASNVLIDISSEETGQKIALQYKNQVGKPLNIAKYLVDHINLVEQDVRWNISVNAVTETQKFWDVVNEYKSYITELDVVLIAPNILNGADKVQEDLRRIYKENGVQETTVKMVNREGKLNPDSKNIRETIDYVGQGGGSAKLKSGKKTIYMDK